MFIRLQGSRLALSLLLACAALALSACAGGPGGAVAYPPSWPLAELTVPAGSRSEKLHFNVASEKMSKDGTWVDGAKVPEDAQHSGGGTMWAVGFHCEENWATVVRDFHEKLRAADCKVFLRIPQAADQHIYGLSRDGSLEVGLFKLDQQRYPDSWELRVTRWQTPIEPGIGEVEEADLLRRLLASQ